MTLPASAAVFFTQEFDSCTTMECTPFGTGGNGAANMLPSTEKPFNGTKSVRLEWVALSGGSQPTAGFTYVGLGVGNQEDIWWSAYMREEPGFTLPLNLHSKMIRITGINHATGGASNPHVWLYRSGCGYRFDVEAPYRSLTNGGTGLGNIIICSNRTMSTTPSNKFDYVEVHAKMNTPGVANGVLQLYVDGTLYINATTVEFRGPTPTSVCGQPTYPCSSNARWGHSLMYVQGGLGIRYYDRFSLGNTRIPPLGGTPINPDITNPNPPTGLTAQ